MVFVYIVTKQKNVQHYIIDCYQFDRERIQLRQINKNVPLSLENVLSPKNQRTILRYVRQTKKYDIL